MNPPRSAAVSWEVRICPLTAWSASREATFTVSPKTSLSRCTTGPVWKPMRRASLLLPTVGSDSTAVCIRVAALAAASGDGNSTITSSPIVFTTRPPSASADWRSRSMQAPMASNAAVSPTES